MSQGDSQHDIGTIRDLLHALILLQSHLRLYGGMNANIEQTTSRLFSLLDRLFATREAITVFVARHGFLYADGFIDRSDRQFEALAQNLFQHGVAALTFQHGVAPGAIHDFLPLVERKSSETWDEGGMAACLAARHVEGLAVMEMSEGDFLLTGSGMGTSQDDLRQCRSALWDKFALAVSHSLHLAADSTSSVLNASPGVLAAVTDQSLLEQPAADKLAFARGASRYLLFLKHEKIRIYRDQALKNLTDFVNSLAGYDHRESRGLETISRSLPDRGTPGEAPLRNSPPGTGPEAYRGGAQQSRSCPRFFSEHR